ncbi:MAG TPA: hypothetical protein VLV50_19025 [Stellaceae bacterium]|nr:hypothetical protein [Stellaceae bacterium]
MRPYILCLVLAVAACGGQYSKPGATADDLSAAQSACNSEAMAKAPPTLGRAPGAPEQNIAPSYACAPGKGCVPTGMSTAPTAPDVTDINADARSHLYDQCMAARGWSK